MGDDKNIEWEYQLKSIFKFCLAFLTAVVISSFIMYLKIAETIGKNYYDALITIKKAEELLLQTVILSVLFQILIGTVCTIIVLIFVSHKVAGPFFRFEKAFEKIAAGDLTFSIILRDKDQFKSLAEQINQMIKSLQDKIKRIKASHSHFDDAYGNLRRHAEYELTEAEFKDLVNSLDKETLQLKKSLTEFEI
jgi:methyl-accepting chemotaxis protein